MQHPHKFEKGMWKKEAGIPDVVKLMKLKVNIWPGQRVLIAKIGKLLFKYVTTGYHYIIWLTIMI